MIYPAGLAFVLDHHIVSVQLIGLELQVICMDA